MKRENLTLSILFADVAQSTLLYEKLGNKSAKKLIDMSIEVMSKAAILNNGTIIKTIGDKIMCTFPEAYNAVTAARDMHKAFDNFPMEDFIENSPLNIYVGIQHGHVIRQANDVFGDAVNVAARMVKQAKQRQILTTHETIESLPANHGFDICCIDKTTIKGKSGEIEIYEVIWERYDLTLKMDSPIKCDTHLKCIMELKFGPKIIEINEDKPTVTLGRQAHNNFVIDDKLVSRSHARIEFRRGKFYLIDQSSNGTFALIQRKKELKLKFSEAQLHGRGIIGLGREVTSNSPFAIHYTIKNKTTPG